MEIREQFNLIAEEYDRNRRKFIPCFDDYYIGTTDFITAGLAKPHRILDLGAGTGLLSSFWYPHFPDTEYVLADIAENMLQIARKRFAGLTNVTYQVTDYSEELPDGTFDAIISALSVHHLENSEKKKLFARIYEQLPDGGLFVNYDQFCAAQKAMDDRYQAYWEQHLAVSGLTAHDIALWQERKQLDRECSVADEIAMLSDCHFQTVECIYSHQKFSVIAAIK